MKQWHHLITLSVLVGVVFGNTLLNGFVWDDFIFLVNNPAYTGFKVKDIWFSLTNGVEYLPVRDMSYALDYALWGNNPLGFHLTNLLLYGVTVLFLYVFFCELLRFYGNEQSQDSRTANQIAFLGAALFAVHPLHSEIVSFITCRNALLSTLFFIISCHFCLLSLRKGGQSRKVLYAVGLGSFAFSLLAKATSITLPFVVLLLHLRHYRREKVKALFLTLPHGLLALGALVLHTSIARQSYVFSNHGSMIDGRTILSKMAVAVQIPLFYLQKFLLPLELSVEYDTPFAPSLASPRAICGLVLLAAAIWMAVRWRKTNPFASFCVGWYFITLIPVTNLFSTHPIVADRYVYLPSIALFFLIAGLLVRLGKQVAVSVAALGIVLVWGGLSMQQNRVWQSDKTLWEHAVRVSPGSPEANIHMGRISFLEGKYDQAFGYFDAARRLNYRSPEYDFFRGYQYFVSQDYREAIAWLDRSLTRDPRFIEALYIKGCVHEALGAAELASDYFRQALQSPEPDIMRLKPLAKKKLDGSR